MKFSIIMASYNQVKFIQQAIESVVNQTYQNYELIIVDGNSTDGSKDIINKYKSNEKIKIVIENDKGLYHARNKGLLIATGDVIGFLNTDDYYELDALNKMNYAFHVNAEYDVIYGFINAVDRFGKFIRQNGNYDFNKEKQIKEYIALPDQSTFFRKKYLARIGLYDSTFTIVADWDFWQRAMVLNLKFIYLNEHIANYRHYDETLTFNPKYINIRFKEVKRLYRKYNDVCLSRFIVKIYYYHYVKGPIKKVKLIEKLYRKINS